MGRILRYNFDLEKASSRKKLKKVGKNLEKGVDNSGMMWYNHGALGGAKRKRGAENFFEKVLKNHLTSGSECAIIDKLSTREPRGKR